MLDVSTNVPTNHQILRRSCMPAISEIRYTSTHMAQGLNPSDRPISTVSANKE